MALDKRALIDGILNVMKDQNGGKEDDQGKMKEFAQGLAEAIDAYVKTGKVETEDGQKPVR
jgi:hypothetical protein